MTAALVSPAVRTGVLETTHWLTTGACMTMYCVAAGRSDRCCASRQYPGRAESGLQHSGAVFGTTTVTGSTVGVPWIITDA